MANSNAPIHPLTVQPLSSLSLVSSDLLPNQLFYARTLQTQT